jgi:hypothetical protein
MNKILNEGLRPDMQGMPSALQQLASECFSIDPTLRPSFSEIVVRISRVGAFEIGVAIAPHSWSDGRRGRHRRGAASTTSSRTDMSNTTGSSPSLLNGVLSPPTNSSNMTASDMTASDMTASDMTASSGDQSLSSTLSASSSINTTAASSGLQFRMDQHRASAIRSVSTTSLLLSNVASATANSSNSTSALLQARYQSQPQIIARNTSVQADAQRVTMLLPHTDDDDIAIGSDDDEFIIDQFSQSPRNAPPDPNAYRHTTR